MEDPGTETSQVADQPNMKTRYTDLAEALPPLLVRLLARHRYAQPLLTSEIADRSGLDPYTVGHISMLLSWDAVPFGQMQAFLKACNADFDDEKQMRRVKAYLRLPNRFGYLKKSEEWPTILQPLVQRYLTHEDRNAP